MNINTFTKNLKSRVKKPKKCNCHTFCNFILHDVSLILVIDNINKKNIDVLFLSIQKETTFILNDIKIHNLCNYYKK